MVHSSSVNSSWVFRKSPLFDNNLTTGGKKVTGTRQRRCTDSEYYNFEIPVNPSYLKRKTASKYKGRFDVVCKIQRRQIRKFHEDAHYVNAYFL